MVTPPPYLAGVTTTAPDGFRCRASLPWPPPRSTLVAMVKIGGLIALGAMALMGACCAALLRDVPDELPDHPAEPA